MSKIIEQVNPGSGLQLIGHSGFQELHPADHSASFTGYEEIRKCLIAQRIS